MSRLWPGGEPILITLDRWQRPLTFLWRGRHHQVGAIHQHWQIDVDWWTEDGRLWRDYFALTTTGGLLCVVYHDHLDAVWMLARLYD